MIPTAQILNTPIEEVTYPTETYKIIVDENRINGRTDDLDAMIQTIYLILNCERYRYLIYSWNYGVELMDLYGKPMPYVMSEVERRLREALTQDDRVETVSDFEFETTHNKLHVKFKVNTIYGAVEVGKEVTF